MQKLDNYIEPIDDEITTSWLLRLADINGLPYTFMVQNYFQDKGDDSEYSIRFRADYQERLDKLCAALDVDNAFEIVMNTTLFNLYSMFRIPSKIAQRVEYSFSNKTNSPLKQYVMRDFSKLHYCPKCLEEDIKNYGYPIFYRSHQVAGVHVCHKHGATLKAYKQRIDLATSQDILNDYAVDLSLKASLKIEKQYAKFVHGLLANNTTATLEDIRKLLQNVIGYEYGKGKDFLEIENKINQSPYSKMIDFKNWGNYLSVTLRSEKFMKKEILLFLLFYFFRTSDALIKALKPFNDKEVDIKSNDIDVIKTYSHGIFLGKCLKCGQYFYSTDFHYQHGFGCSHCDELLPAEVLINRVINKTGDSEYNIEASINNIMKSSQKIQLRHICGTVFSSTLNRFIWEEQKCPCNYKVIRNEVLKRFKKSVNGEYELLNVSSSIYNSAKIRHKECGEIFYVNCLANWITSPHCPVCSPSKYNTKHIQKRIKDLVGDDYTLIGEYTPHVDGDYSGNMTLRCNKCGKEIRYDTTAFFAGARCKCVPRLDEQQFKEFVEYKSYGEYEITNKKCRRDDCVIIKNKLNGKEKQMERILIRQELTRPTPSTILPLSNRKTPNPNNYEVYREQIYEYLKRNFKSNEIFSFKEDVGEIFVNGVLINEQQRRSAVGVLKSQHKLFLVYNSIYCLEDRDFTIDEILEALYIKRHNKLLGYWTEESYLYQRGIIDNKPEVPKITTKIVHHNVVRDLKRLPNSKTCLKSPHIKDFSDKDIPYLAFLDLFRYKGKIKYSDEDLYQFIKKLNLNYEKLFELLEKYPKRIQEKFNYHIKKGILYANKN